MIDHRLRRRMPRRVVYLVPNLFTAVVLLCGFYAIVKSLEQELVLAGWAIIAAAFFDMLDGRVARLTGTQSEFGKQFDSLSDVVSFGVAPAILAHQWGLAEFGRLGFTAGFFFAAAAAVRLARFNVATAVQHGRFFVGLPSPVAGVTAASAVLVAGEDPALGNQLLVFLLMLLIAATMVSEVKYHSFKQIDFTAQIKGSLLIVAALVVLSLAVLVVLEFGAGSFLVCGLLYLLYGYFLAGRLVMRQIKSLRARGDSGLRLLGKLIIKTLGRGYRS